MCKNIECKNETIGKRVYCSLTCRNIYVNKYLRDYTKYSKTCEKKKKEREIEYLETPFFCKNCYEVIEYEKRNNEEFCGHSCRASFTNGNRDYTKWSLKISKSLCKFYNSSKVDGYYNLICNFCKESFRRKRKDIKFCSKSCKKLFFRVDKDEYKSYKNDCNFKFNLSDYKEEFDFSLVEKYGWYSPTNKKNNLGGVSRDHMVSVREGFENKIDPKIISHPANCKLMIHNENVSKHKKSSISLEDLMEKIKKFENKYGILI